jgi:16S rRNA processing protein RimM
VRGEVRVVPLALDEPFPADARVVRVCSRTGATRVLEVEAARSIHQAWLLTFNGIDDREAARQLSGWALEVDAAVLPPAEEGELYVYELEGAAVVNEAGERIGVVRRLVDNHGQDLLEIDAGGRELLLPFVEDTVVAFDRERGVLTVRPIAGLWGDNDG